MKKLTKLTVALALSATMFGCSSQTVSTIQEDGDTFESKIYTNSDDVQTTIEQVYTESYSEQIYDEIEELKTKSDYDENDPLVIHNPYGTNTTSLYVYFKTDKKVSVSYTVRAEGYNDFSGTVDTFSKEHEFTVLGLIPNQTNTITLTLVDESGNETTTSFDYEMSDILGTEDIQLTETEESQAVQTSTELSSGLYVILGNDSDDLDFMYYYDNDGVLRGEVPIIGYRSHRLLFTEDNEMIFSVGKHTIAKMNSLGQITKIYKTGDYELHHDYQLDEDENLIVLASKEAETVEDSYSEDLIIKIDGETGEIIGTFDMADVLGDYKETCILPEDYNQEGVKGMDWVHLNTLQYIGDDSIIVSARETSTIIKIDDVFSDASIDYMIGQTDLWEESGYDDLLLEQVGDFSNTGGQHTVTYEEDETLEEGQYYIYLFNNNYGRSTTQPDYDWTQIENIFTVGTGQMDDPSQAYSLYYKYLIDENQRTYELVSSFEVPYSSYISSAQHKDGNIIIDSGAQGILGEYDSEGTLLKQYKIKMNTYMIYRIYKYDFN